MNTLPLIIANRIFEIKGKCTLVFDMLGMMRAVSHQLEKYDEKGYVIQPAGFTFLNVQKLFRVQIKIKNVTIFKIYNKTKLNEEKTIS